MLNEIIERAIQPAYALLPAGMRSREATVLLLCAELGLTGEQVQDMFDEAAKL